MGIVYNEPNLHLFELTGLSVHALRLDKHTALWACLVITVLKNMI